MFYYFFLAIYVQHPKFQRNKIISLFLDCVHTKDIPEDVLNTYCWIHSTYTIPSAFWKRIGKDHCKYSYIVSIEMWIYFSSNQSQNVWSWLLKKNRFGLETVIFWVKSHLVNILIYNNTWYHVNVYWILFLIMITWWYLVII